MKVNPANAYRNGTLYPSYTAAATQEACWTWPTRHKVNLISILSWSFEFENKEYFEGFRSLSTNGIDKPVLNFFRMVALMKGERIATTSSGQVKLDDIMAGGVRGPADVDALASADARQAAVMLWNYHDAEKPGLTVSATLTDLGPAQERCRRCG